MYDTVTLDRTSAQPFFLKTTETEEQQRNNNSRINFLCAKLKIHFEKSSLESTMQIRPGLRADGKKLLNIQEDT